ncbi:MAG: response regulator [Anaerolineales bacterium]
MPARILIVDDSPVTAKAAQMYLDAAGYQVELALDGPTALKTVEKFRPELILLDVVMPGMDGFEVCRRLRQMTFAASVPILMLTSNSSIADKKTGFEAGADDYLTKPVEAVELQMRVAAQLRRVQRSTAEAPQLAASRTVAVFSLRGGVGCTSLAVNLAVGLSKLWGVPLPLLDLARPVGVCDSMLNLKPRHRLDTLVARPYEEIDATVIDGSLTPHESGLHLLAGFEDPVLAEQLTDKMVNIMLEHLRQQHPLVVIDTAHDLSPVTVAALDQADVVVIPIAPDLNSIRLAHTALNIFKSLGYEEKETILALNWTFPKQGLARAQIEKTLNHPVQLVIPYAESVWVNAINVGVPLVLADPKSPLTAMLEDTAWRISDPRMRQAQPVTPTPTWQRVTQRLKAHDAQLKVTARP